MLADAVAAIGTPRFDDMFIAAVDRVVPVEHATIQSYTAEDGMNAIAVMSKVDLAVCRSLTRDYAGGLFRLDPNFPEIARRTRSRRIVVRRHDPARIASRAYLARFYAGSGIVDKVALIWHEERTGFHLNLYRTAASGRFAAAEVAAIAALAPLLAAIARQHCQHFLVRRDLSANNLMRFIGRVSEAAAKPLTAREIAVVSRLLLGFRAEAVALDLAIGTASVVTYRKRAYRKLGIASLNELFALCLRNLHRFVR